MVKTTGTQYFTYPFGLMDSTYTGSGVQVLENDYYTLAGRLIGERESGVTVFLLTDELGSVLTSLSAAAGSAAVTSTQVYSPYGTPRYKRGTVPTDKGFTGQYRDGSGLDYYNARYYDPVVGRFVSADTAQGNGQGMDPYSYVGNNPETLNDPTGRMPCAGPKGPCGFPSPPSNSGGGGNKGGNHCGPGTHSKGGECVGNSSDTNFVKGVNQACGSLTQKECTNGKNRRNDQVAFLQRLLAAAQIGAGLIALIFDVISAWKNMSNDIIKAVGDVLSALGDISSILSGIGAAFHINGINVIADGISTIMNILAGAYQLASNTWWGIGVLRNAVGLAVKVFSGINAPELLLNISVVFLEHALKMDLAEAGKGIILSLVQGFIGGTQTYLDSLNNENVDKYCAGSC